MFCPVKDSSFELTYYNGIICHCGNSKDIFTVMHLVIVFCGIISCLTVGTFCETVTIVQNDQYVQASNASHKYNVTLTCIGSNPELRFYIIDNMVIWSFTDVRGVTQNLTQSFTGDPINAYSKAKFNSKSLNIIYEEGTSSDGLKIHKFVLQIIGISHTDNGIYNCLLQNKSKIIIDSKQVRVTVLNPVEYVNIELLKDGVRMIQKTSPSTIAIQNSTRLSPGPYRVKCSAYNSNPAPTMQLFFENKEQTVFPNIEEKVSDIIRYTGTYETTVVLKNHNYPQTLECRANVLVNNTYQKTVSIQVLIPVEQPFISCDNLTAYETDHYRSIKCTLATTSQYVSLTCDKVSWRIGDINKNLSSEERWKDLEIGYDIIETMCHQDDTGAMLNVTFTFYDMKPIHFSSVYFLIYKSEFVHPVEIYQLISVARPLSHISILVTVLLALASQQTGKYL